jgi:hypothetical protein
MSSFAAFVTFDGTRCNHSTAATTTAAAKTVATVAVSIAVSVIASVVFGLGPFDDHLFAG